MRISHNIPALQTATSLAKTGKRLDKATRSMTTGFKINSAKDDAASMAVANKLRTQVQGLRTASQNALDGISLIQTAEGALGEIQNMLQRIRELTVQAANGIYGTEPGDNDKEKMMMEVKQLLLEITDTAKKTEFNKIKVLSGELEQIDEKNEFYDTIDHSVNSFVSRGLVLQIGPNKTMEMYVSLDKITASSLALFKGWDGEIYNLEQRISYDKIDPFDPFDVRGGNTGPPYDLKKYPPWLPEFQGFKYDIGDPDDNASRYAATIPPWEPTEWLNANPGSVAYGPDHLNVISDWQLWQKWTISGTADLVASKSIEAVDQAIADVSDIRARLGAVQNRLEHTVLSLENNAQNTEESRSRIEDTDMAYESIIYSSSQVVSQAAIAILAQANQRPHQILQLMR